MKFYNRGSEIQELETLFAHSQQEAQMTVLTGRRRMGKTILALHCFEKRKYIY